MTRMLDLQDLTLHYNTAKSRLILFDYDGTLVPFKSNPGIIKPGEDLSLVINALAADQRNHVVVISGRGKEDLDVIWGGTPIVLVAEHGGFYKNPGNVWQEMFAISGDWIQKILSAFKALTFQYEGSILE